MARIPVLDLRRRSLRRYVRRATGHGAPPSRRRRLFGMGGPQMRAAGVETVVDSSDVGVLGVVEIVRKLPALRQAWRRLLSEIDRRRPTLAILTDFPALSPAPCARASPQANTQRLFRLPAVLGLAALAGKAGEAPFRPRPVHFSVRVKLSFARRESRWTGSAIPWWMPFTPQCTREDFALQPRPRSRPSHRRRASG